MKSLQEYINDKIFEKASIATLKSNIMNDPTIPTQTKQSWINQITQASKAKDIIELFSMIFG